MALREKIALVYCIILVCGMFGFITFGMSMLLCGKSSAQKIVKYQPGKNIAGHRNAYGFIVPDQPGPRYLPLGLQECPELQKGICSKCKVFPKLATYPKMVFAWSDLAKDPFLFSYNGDVINATKLDLTKASFNHSQIDKILDNPDILDVTASLNKRIGGKHAGQCLSTWFKVGEIAQFPFPCLISKAFTLTLLSVLICLVVIKFLMALCYSWFVKVRGDRHDHDKLDSSQPPILLFVTCYNEGAESIQRTLNSLVDSNYDDRQKLAFVVCDGIIKSSEDGQGRLTADIVSDMIVRKHESDPKWYYAVARGARRANRSTITLGEYHHNGRQVKMILVKKVGNSPTDNGNRGKRDSQLIMMGWLQRVLFNELLSELDYQLTVSVDTLMGTGSVQLFDHVLMVDADTILDTNALTNMMAVMERDRRVMGLCGETKIMNKNESMTTRIRVFEYYQSHHLGKAFESAFGAVTCLPGCFSMYRIKVKKGDLSYIPLLASPEIIDSYNRLADPRSLHERNLLDLGEDRYLTTLMMRTFPNRKLVYVPSAICFTRVPSEFIKLLSQRRRWINSTVHNLWVLLRTREMCGVFCCSMQFVIFIELLGTLMLPASMVFTGFLIYAAIIDPYAAMAPLTLLCLILGLPSVLILMTSNIGMVLWMIVYLAALPIWNFIMPLYAFWRFDDFAWGAKTTSNGDHAVHDNTNTVVIERRYYSEWSRSTAYIH